MPRFASTFRVNFDAKFASKFYVLMILVQNFVGSLTLPAGEFPSSSSASSISNTTNNVWKITRELDCCGDEQRSSVTTNSSENENNYSNRSHPQSASGDDKLLIEFYKLYFNLYEKRLLDDESMQADQSSPSASFNGSIFDSKTNTTDDRQKQRREMDKENRKKQIQDYVTKYFPDRWQGDKLPTSGKMLPPISGLPPPSTSSDYPKLHVKKFPSCSFPAQNTSNDLWFVGRNINLYFDIPELQKSDSSIINNVIVGELRLYKLPVKLTELENDSEEDEDSDPSNIDETIAKSNQTIPPKLVATMKEDLKIMERQIKVTIYRRGGPKTKKDASRTEERSEVKRNKDGKKAPTLVNSTVMKAFSEGTIKFNIIDAVKIWEKNLTRNHGIKITVEDDKGNILPARQFFHIPNCSTIGKLPPPLPSIFLDNQKKPFKFKDVSDSMNVEYERAPSLDVGIERIPAEDMLLSRIKRQIAYLEDDEDDVEFLQQDTSHTRRMRHDHSSKENEKFA